MNLKAFVKSTRLYSGYKEHQNKQKIKRWSPSDDEWLAFYGQFISANDLVFDVGANIGNRVKIFLKLGAKVIAFEPQKSCMKILNKLFRSKPGFKLEPIALGQSPGYADMYISDASTISSLSDTWIKAVTASGRFSNYRWDGKQEVEISTLDKMLDEHGIPVFIKIDVEGFEYEVIKGLSVPIRYLSFEFASEVIDNSFQCINHLSEMGTYIYNYTMKESKKFYLDSWKSQEEIISELNNLKTIDKSNGDIYAKLV